MGGKRRRGVASKRARRSKVPPAQAQCQRIEVLRLTSVDPARAEQLALDRAGDAILAAELEADGVAPADRARRRGELCAELADYLRARRLGELSDEHATPKRAAAAAQLNHVARRRLAFRPWAQARTRHIHVSALRLEAKRRGVRWFQPDYPGVHQSEALLLSLQDEQRWPTPVEIFALSGVDWYRADSEEGNVPRFTSEVPTLASDEAAARERVLEQWLLFDRACEELPEVLRSALALVEPWRLACAVAAYRSGTSPAWPGRRVARSAARMLGRVAQLSTLDLEALERLALAWELRRMAERARELTGQMSLAPADPPTRDEWWTPVVDVLRDAQWTYRRLADLLLSNGWSLPIAQQGDAGALETTIRKQHNRATKKVRR